ncbi:MAG: hypothetical protein ACRCX8_18745 [Sarcina sp.]
MEFDGKDWSKDGKELSRNYPQGNRIYDEKGISCTVTSQGGGYGSYSGLYKIKNKGENIMWKNNLEKLNYEMDEVRLFDAFAGKGALHKSLKN